ncbi:MAG: nucleotidyltransferase family protein [Bdellovibrionales bacterium]
MTQAFSSTAMVLAAGFGMRMRPLTLTTPKPLQIIGGRTMLDHALDKLIKIGVKRVVINTFYLAEQIEAHVKSRRDIEIVISREEELLDTGGGIAKALPYFEGLPFFCLNADLPWLDGDTSSLTHMREAWKPEIMDALLLVMRTEKARGFPSTGDYAMENDGRLKRKNVPTPRPFVMISAQILKPDLFARPPAKVFSNNVIWDAAEARQRLYGIEHNGTCYHVGTPDDLRIANELLASGKGWGV